MFENRIAVSNIDGDLHNRLLRDRENVFDAMLSASSQTSNGSVGRATDFDYDIASPLAAAASASSNRDPHRANADSTTVPNSRRSVELQSRLPIEPHGTFWAEAV